MGAWRTGDLCYKLFFEAGTQGMLLASTAGTLLDANSEACAILGYGREELLRIRLRSLVDLSDPEAKEIFGGRRLRAARRVELRLVRRNGSTVPVEASIVQPADGSDDNMIGIAFRQRGRVQTEAEESPDGAEEVRPARRSVDPAPVSLAPGDGAPGYGLLLQTSTDGLLVADAGEWITDANPAACKLLGRARERLVGRALREVVDPSYPLLEAAREELGEGVIKVGGRFLRGDGGSFPAEVWMVRERGDGLVVLFRDLSGRGEPDGVSQGGTERFDALVEHALDLITVCNPDNTIRYISPSARSILGYEPEEMVGVFVPGLIHPDDLESSVREAARVHADPHHKPTPIRYRRKDGSYVYLENYLTNLLEDPNVRAVVVNSRDVTERVLAERALKRSEERFRALVENAQDLVAICEPDSTLRYVSPAVRRILGYEPEELVGVFVPTLLHPEEIEVATEIFERSNRTPGPSEPFTLRSRRKDGSWVYLETVFTNLLSDPSVGAIVANSRDVTERVRQQEELRRLNDELERRVRSRTAQLRVAMEEADDSEEMLRLSEERWRALIRYASDLTVVLAADGTIRYESPAVERILGFRPEDRVGTNAFDHLHPDDVEPVRSKVAEILERPDERMSVEYRVRDRQGVWHHFEAIGVNLLDNPIIGGIVVNTRDITERKRAERALAESERRFRNSFRYAAIGMALVAVDGRWLQVNRALCEIVGYAEEELLEKSYQDITHPDDLEVDLDLTRGLVAGEIETYAVEKRYLHKEGRVVWISVSGSLMRGEEGEPLYFISQMQDITERKEAEERLREAEQRYRSVVEEQTELVCRFRPDLTLTFVNEAYCRYFGQEPEQLIGEGFLKRIPKEDHVYYEGDSLSLSPEDPTRTVEHRVFAPGGGVRWQQWTDRAIFDEDGRIVEYQTVGRDVTERREAEEALKKSEAGLAEAQRIAHLGGWGWDLQTDELSWSDEVYRICGLDPEDDTPNFEKSWELVHPEDRGAVETAIDEALYGNTPYDLEHRIVRPDGEVRWVHRRTEVVLQGEGGEPLQMVGTFHDITERKRAERRLEAQYALARVLEESATFEEALSRILQTVCEYLEWDVGAFWHRDRRADALRCAQTWHTDSLDVRAFEAVTRGHVFSRGEGFPGHVWASGEPLWAADVTEAPGFQRAPAAAREGLLGALALPIMLRGELLGVAEFFSCERRQPDAALLDTMETIAAQVGQFIERRRAEDELRGAERRYRTLIEQLPAVTYIQDVETNTLSYVSPQLEAVLGYTPEEYLADPALRRETIHPEDREWVLAEDERTDRTGEPYVAECRRVRKDGRVVWARDEARLVRDAGGAPLFWQGLLTDVTERKRSEEALRQSERLYRSVVEQAAENIFLVDAETRRILEANPALHASLGYTAEELSEMTLYDIVAHERESVDLNVERILSGGHYFIGERQYMHRDGSLVDVEVNVSAISYGGREAMCIVAHDVTERKEAEEGLRRNLEVLLALREAGQILGSTLESDEIVSDLLNIMRRVSNLVTSVTTIRDEDGRVRLWRSAGLENLWPGARFAPEAEAARRAVLEDETQQLLRIRGPGDDGEELTGLYLPLRTRDRVLGVLEAYGSAELANQETIEILYSLTSQAASALANALLYQDLAEREQRLQDLVGQLLRTQEEERRRVAYEVHDSLAQVATAAHQRLQTFARRYPPDSRKAEDDLGRIVGLVHQTVGEARRIIANLRPTTLDDFGLAAAVGQALDELREEGWSVSCEENLGSERLPGPLETALFRVAQEALTNARKHAGVREVHVELSRENGSVRLRVRDEGRGFDPDSLLTAGPGERVGLAGMRERITLLGGRFELWSRPGEGTAVTVDVPLRPTEGDEPDGE